MISGIVINGRATVTIVLCLSDRPNMAIYKLVVQFTEGGLVTIEKL